MAETSSIGPVEAFWRYRAWTVPITIVIGLLAGLFALATSGTNTATTTLYLTDPRGTPVFRDGSSTPTDLARYARQRAEFADSAAVHEAVVDAIDAQRESLAADPETREGDLPAVETVESIDDVVSTGTTSSADVRIDCTADSETRALLICDEVVAAYLVLTAQDIAERADATIAAFLVERDRLVAESGRPEHDRPDRPPDRRGPLGSCAARQRCRVRRTSRGPVGRADPPGTPVRDRSDAVRRRSAWRSSPGSGPDAAP